MATCTIAIATHKGGTGKTVTAMALSAAFARAGQTCLLVDLGDFCPTPRKGIFQGSSSQTCRTETRASVSTISVILIVSGALRNS